MRFRNSFLFCCLVLAFYISPLSAQHLQLPVRILTTSGKGYTLMEGYKVPPVMFTESEANALITVEQLLLKKQQYLAP